jgi:peptide deformylase
MSKSNAIKGNVVPVRIYGDKVLRKKSEPVKEINDELLGIIADLIATMYAKDGIGLAAPQIGHNLRIFVVDPEWFQTNEMKPRVFINPKFLSMSGVEIREEGCLSLPDIFAEVKRAEEVVVEAIDEKGELIKHQAVGLFARAIQHEYDHLDGVLFFDRVAKIKQLSLRAKLKRLENNTDKNGVNLDEDYIAKQNNLHGNA